MPDLEFYGIMNFLKKGRGSSNFLKIRAIILKLHTNILYRSRDFGIEFGQNRLKRWNFFRFFSKLSNSGKFHRTRIVMYYYILNMQWIHFIPNQSFMNILHDYKLVSLP